MGNLFSNETKYTLADIENLKNTLGTVGEPVFSWRKTSSNSN